MTASPMRLVVILLNKPELLDELLTGLLEIGVQGATVVDSVGMGHILSHDVPIFAGLRDVFSGSHAGNKTILIVTAEETVAEIAAISEDICGSFEAQGTGLLLSVPVDLVKGLRPPVP